MGDGIDAHSMASTLDKTEGLWFTFAIILYACGLYLHIFVTFLYLCEVQIDCDMDCIESD